MILMKWAGARAGANEDFLFLRFISSCDGRAMDQDKGGCDERMRVRMLRCNHS